MATLAGQRAQLTYALNQYNLSDDPDRRTKFVRAMAKYIAAASSNGFTVEQVTKGQTYPVAEVNAVIAANATEDPGITEEQAQRTVDEAVDSSDVIRIGEGAAAVYAYGYRGHPDRLKVGSHRSRHGATNCRSNWYEHTGQTDPPPRDQNK